MACHDSQELNKKAHHFFSLLVVEVYKMELLRYICYLYVTSFVIEGNWSSAVLD